jgi:pilus assembly protein CpaF
MEDIFFYDIEGVDADGKVKGEWKASGVTPVFFPRFKKAGIDLAQEIFNKD